MSNKDVIEGCLDSATARLDRAWDAAAEELDRLRQGLARALWQIDQPYIDPLEWDQDHLAQDIYDDYLAMADATEGKALSEQQEVSPQMERRIGQDALRANSVLVGARVVATWLTERDGWIGLALQHDFGDEQACTVLVNPIDIRFRQPQAEA